MKKAIFVVVTGLGSLAACGSPPPCPTNAQLGSACSWEGQRCDAPPTPPDAICDGPSHMDCSKGVWVGGPMPTCNPPAMEEEPPPPPPQEVAPGSTDAKSEPAPK